MFRGAKLLEFSKIRNQFRKDFCSNDYLWSFILKANNSSSQKKERKTNINENDFH